MKINRTVKRTLLLVGVMLTAIGLTAFAAIAMPMEYRTPAWRRLPLLDHRILPHVSAVFAAVFGAFFGSLSAFYLGRMQQRSDRREKRHAALIEAQYALMSQWNVVEAIRVQHLQDLRNDPVRFTKLKLYWFPIAPAFVPLTDLIFILETKDPNLLHEIHLAELNYRGCTEALQMRNQELQKFYDNPRVSHEIRNFETGAGVSSATDRDLIFLRQATDALYISVDRALPRIAAAIQKLEKVIKIMFPDKQALRMIPENPSAEASAEAPTSNQ
jgi:hypothetical protein